MKNIKAILIFSDRSETASQFVIPAKSRRLSGEASAKTEAGREPGSRIICFSAIPLDSPSTSLRVVSLSNHGARPE